MIPIFFGGISYSPLNDVKFSKDKDTFFAPRVGITPTVISSTVTSSKTKAKRFHSANPSGRFGTHLIQHERWDPSRSRSRMISRDISLYSRGTAMRESGDFAVSWHQYDAWILEASVRFSTSYDLRFMKESQLGGLRYCDQSYFLALSMNSEISWWGWSNIRKKWIRRS